MLSMEMFNNHLERGDLRILEEAGMEF